MGEIAQFESGAALSPIERCYYEATSAGGRFWLKLDEKYHARSERQLVRWLKSEGFAGSVTKDEAAAGQVLSDVDKALLEITDDRAVDFAGPYSGWHAGARSISGHRVLVTESPVLIGPKSAGSAEPRLEESLPWGGDCAGWPNLGKFLHRAFTGDLHGEAIDQLPYHFAWLRRGYLALKAGQPNRGHALIMAGDPGCGKSLHIDIITSILGGSICRPLRYIFGESNFNAEMFTASHLVIDDEGAKTNIGDRKIVGARTKQVVAVRGASCEGKNKDSFELETFKRLTFATNMEEQNLLVLPPIDEDLADKVHVFKFYSGAWPWPESSSEDHIWDLIASELPYFIGWLLDEFELPEDLLSQRFGVKQFHHPEILEGIDFLSPEARLWGWVERTVLRATDNSDPNGLPLPVGEWQGSAVDLETALRDEDSGLSYKEREKVPSANPTIGKFLTKLSTRPTFARRISQRRLPGGKKRAWVLLSQERAEEQQNQPEQEDIKL